MNIYSSLSLGIMEPTEPVDIKKQLCTRSCFNCFSWVSSNVLGGPNPYHFSKILTSLPNKAFKCTSNNRITKESHKQKARIPLIMCLLCYQHAKLLDVTASLTHAIFKVMMVCVQFRTSAATVSGSNHHHRTAEMMGLPLLLFLPDLREWRARGHFCHLSSHTSFSLVVACPKLSLGPHPFLMGMPLICRH